MNRKSKIRDALLVGIAVEFFII